MTDLCAVLRNGVNLHLALIHNSVELILDLRIENLSDMFQTEAGVISLLADTQADHITLSGVHDSLDAVQIAVEFTLKYRLEVSLHALSGNFYNISNLLFASHFHLVNVGSDQLDLMILDLGKILHLNKLYTVHAGAVKLNLHITAADDLALECGTEGYRNINLCDLNLNATCLVGSCDKFGNILLDNQALRNAECLFICNNRESKSNRAGAACNNDLIQRCESINKGRNTLLGVFHQSCRVARFNISEDQGRTNGNRNNMDHSGDVLSKRNDTDIGAHLNALLCTLINNISDQSYQLTLSLILLDDRCAFFCRRSLSDNNRNTGDIAGNKRNTQLTNRSIRKMSGTGSFVRSRVVNIFQNLDELRAECGCNTGHKSVMQPGLPGHQSFYNTKSLLELLQVCNLGSSYRIITGKAVCGAWERNCLVLAVFCDCVINRFFGQAINSVITCENHIK